MDLRDTAAPPNEAERHAVDAVLGPQPSELPIFSAGEANALRTSLLPALLSIQERLGFISPSALGYACRRLGVPPAEGYGVATFYSLLALGPRAEAFAHVCDDVVCRNKGAGAGALADRLRERISPARPASAARWSQSPCLGLCEQGPAALVTVAGERPTAQAFGDATAERVEAALSGREVPATPCPVESLGPRRLLRRAGRVDPLSFEDFKANHGGEGLARALELGPESVIREVTKAKLLGRGGAAFPTGKKWQAVAGAPAHPHFVVCNADESEPGTFKDRALLERDPFAVIEAMAVAAFAVGARKGYLYLRGEYPLAKQRLEHAIATLRQRRLLGDDILGRGFAFDVELRCGAGAYICGEETALFNSIEGFRGEPRSKPPFPVEVGLFGQPTAVNNVETLVAALDIVREGAAAYTSTGTTDSPGTKLFCVSGAVRRAGVFEVPFGTPLGCLLELAGGVPQGRTLTAILLGGAAGRFVGPQALSMPLSFEGARHAGATLGSGVVAVFDDETDFAGVARRLAAFFRDESCGQCVPCRVGTVRQAELVDRLIRGSPHGSVEEEAALWAELSQAMRDASICGLGQSASSALLSLNEMGLLRARP